MKYAYFCDRVIGKRVSAWQGFIDSDGKQEPIVFKKFNVNMEYGVIQGSGMDADGDYTINGYIRKNDVKFRLFYFGSKNTILYYGVINQSGTRIVGNEVKNDKSRKIVIDLAQMKGSFLIADPITKTMPVTVTQKQD